MKSDIEASYLAARLDATLAEFGAMSVASATVDNPAWQFEVVAAVAASGRVDRDDLLSAARLIGDGTLRAAAIAQCLQYRHRQEVAFDTKGLIDEAVAAATDVIEKDAREEILVDLAPLVPNPTPLIHSISDYSRQSFAWSSVGIRVGADALLLNLAVEAATGISEPGPRSVAFARAAAVADGQEDRVTARSLACHAIGESWKGGGVTLMYVLEEVGDLLARECMPAACLALAIAGSHVPRDC